jgi:hypothetical protein
VDKINEQQQQAPVQHKAIISVAATPEMPAESNEGFQYMTESIWIGIDAVVAVVAAVATIIVRRHIKKK